MTLRREFLILNLEYISLQPTFALEICFQISSAKARMQLSFGKAASPYFNPVCRILFFSISYGKIWVFSAQQAKLLTKGFGMFFSEILLIFFVAFPRLLILSG